MRVLGVGMVLLAALASDGCGDGSTGNPGPTLDGSVPAGQASQFVDQLADELCVVAAQCCPSVGHTAPSDCTVRARQQLHDDIDAEIASGAGFHADAADECLAGYRLLTTSCPAAWSSPAACHQALIGTAKPGESCDRGCAPSPEGDVVCAFTLTLGGDAGQSKSPQICQVEISTPPGEACDVEVTKPILRVCDPAGGSWCLGGLCSVPVAMGGTCHGDDCILGAYCTNGICQPTLPKGDTCTGTPGECEAGISCEMSTMVCKAADPWKRLCGGAFD